MVIITIVSLVPNRTDLSTVAVPRGLVLVDDIRYYNVIHYIYIYIYYDMI